MSFFGFDTTLPRDRERNAGAPGFFSPPDPFAGISKPAADVDNGDDDDDDNALEFEDTYDGLGDQLDDADDVLNEDTFGETTAAPASQASVGKDFDFFGQTAKVADAIDEEHMRYSRQVIPSKAPAVDTGNVTRAAPKPVRTGYEKYKDQGSDLKVNASLWGVGPQRAADVGGPSHEEHKTEAGSRAVPARTMLSLEEVEAAMLAQSKKRPTTQEQPSQAATTLPAVGGHHGQVQAHLAEGQAPVVLARRPPQSVAQPSSVPPSHPPPMPVHPSVAYAQREQIPPVRPAEPKLYNEAGPAAAPPPQPRQILQNPNRHPLQAQQLPPRAMMEPRMPPPHGPVVPGGPMQRVPPMPHPQQMMHMSEEERLAFLTEEAKRAKRNHKIHLLSKDNGLMTPQDKNFVTRIQLQQLVSATGNPNELGTDAALAEDFYYQVHSHIRGGPRANPQQPLNHFAQTYLFQTGARHGGAVGRRLQRGGDAHVQRMEQQVQRAVEAAKLKPKNKQLVIEGSLGKISFSNAKTPKPLLNIKRPDSAQDANRPPGPGRTASERRSQSYMAGKGHRRETLRQIESVYTALMRMEDHERHMPPMTDAGEVVTEQQAEWASQMKELNQKLWSELKVMEPIVPNSPVPHPFIAFLSFAKGKRVIPRIFRQIHQQQRVTILTMIVVHIGILDVVRRAQLRPGERQLPSAVREDVELFSQAVMPSLFGYVNEAPLNQIIDLLGILLASADVQAVARSKIGLSILTMFLSRAELVKQSGNVDDEDWNHWTALYGRLFDSLEAVLGMIFPGSVNAGEDMYVWQFLAAIGLGASAEQQQRLVMAVKDRVMETVAMSKTLPPEMASQRLGNVNLFMRAIGLDVEWLE